MSRLSLSFACGLYDRMLPLYTRDVVPDGIDLNYIVLDDPRQIFDRMAGGLEFDVAEMSSSEFVGQQAAGKSPFVALPVFASRVFRHGFVTVNRAKGINTPKDLAGKRIGVPLYTMSAAIWIRGHLMHDFGVDLSNVTWVQGSINDPTAHGNPSPPPLLKPVKVEQNRSGRSLSDLLDAGEIDAIIGTDIPHAIKSNPNVQRLWPNFREIERELYRTRKIFPIMHLIVIKKSVYERHPFVATSLYNAFVAAKELALKKMKYVGAYRYMLPWLMSEVDEINEVFGGDPWPYGVAPNRPTLEALTTYLAEQGVTAAKADVDKLFVPTYG